MDWKTKNINAYNDHALEYAESFKKFGARVADIDRALKLSDATEKPRVIEIGCGDGRDAEYIITHCDWYQGVDPSKNLLALARNRLPGAGFVLADALSYGYPTEIDVVFAFASLLHVDKSDLSQVIPKIIASLKTGGVLLVSLKERDIYTEETKTDELGVERMFYYYTPMIIQSLCVGMSVVYEDHQHIGVTDWFTLALKKV